MEICAFCHAEIMTNVVWMTECFSCGRLLPCCSDECVDRLDCLNCLDGITEEME